MHYELYIDSILFGNLMMNFYLLTLTNISTLRTATPQRICVGALLGSLGFLFSFFSVPFPFTGFATGFAIGTIGMLLYTFRIKCFKNFVCMTKYMLVNAFCMGGCLLFLGNVWDPFRKLLNHPVGLASVSSIVFLLLCRVKDNRNWNNCTCMVRLRNGEKDMEVPALIDSGNSLVEPISGKPVCVITQEIYERLLLKNSTGFRVIPYHSVGRKHGVLPGYLLDEVEIDYEGLRLRFQNIYVAVEKNLFNDDSASRSIKIIVNPALFQRKKCGSRLGGRM